MDIWSKKICSRLNVYFTGLVEKDTEAQHGIVKNDQLYLQSLIFYDRADGLRPSENNFMSIRNQMC